MKRLLSVSFAIIAISCLTMSCNKEYNCECDSYNVIIEAASTAEAEVACATNGASCSIR